MHQTFLAAADRHKSAEINNTGYFTIIDPPDFNFSGNLFDTTNGVARFLTVGGRNLNGAVIFDFDGGPGFLGQGTNNRTAFTNHVLDLIRINLDGMNAWSELRNIATRVADCLLHYTQDMQTRALGLI